jgi:hypothetical protein
MLQAPQAQLLGAAQTIDDALLLLHYCCITAALLMLY